MSDSPSGMGGSRPQTSGTPAPMPSRNPGMAPKVDKLDRILSAIQRFPSQGAIGAVQTYRHFPAILKAQQAQQQQAARTQEAELYKLIMQGRQAEGAGTKSMAEAGMTRAETANLPEEFRRAGEKHSADLRGIESQIGLRSQQGDYQEALGEGAREATTQSRELFPGKMKEQTAKAALTRAQTALSEVRMKQIERKESLPRTIQATADKIEGLLSEAHSGKTTQGRQAMIALEIQVLTDQLERHLKFQGSMTKAGGMAIEGNRAPNIFELLNIGGGMQPPAGTQ